MNFQRKNKWVYENIVSGIDEEILLISKDYKIVWANQKSIDIYGSNIIDKHCYYVTHGIDFPCQGPFDLCPIYDVLATGKSSSTTHAHASIHDSGSQHHVLINVYPIRNGNDEIVRFVHIAKDVTESVVHRQIEEKMWQEIIQVIDRIYAELVDNQMKIEKSTAELEERTAELERSSLELRKTQEHLIRTEKLAAIGQLAAGVAHEIRNQLTPVLTEAQRLLVKIENGKELSPQFVMERAQTIEEATRTANKITMALLDYARESRPEFNRYNLRDSIEGVMALYQSDCKQANIQAILEDVEVEEILADKRQIEQVLINMINNAYEAILEKGKGGSIAISVKREEPYIVISIRDTGIGIPKEDQGKIFDPFFTTKSPRGVGLGLSVSYGIVERHGGRIDFDSEFDLGATFRIYLPIKEDIKDAISI